MINIVVPVKNPSGAKQRLSGVLTEDQRAILATTLLEDVLRTLVHLPFEAHVLVVTDNRPAADLAESLGATALIEEKSEGETRAIERATAWSIARGFDLQAVIPGDMARLDALEVTALLSIQLPAPSIVLCPAVGDDGTNAILTSPPDVIPFRFGARSFHDYLEKAERLDVSCTVLRLPSLVLDLDTPEDLDEFLRSPARTRAHELLAEWGITAGMRVSAIAKSG